MAKVNTKQLIIETASELFYQKGYNLTGINEIIREASIAKATLYRHFKSKEDLCIAYLELKQETLITELSKFCVLKPAGKERIVAVIEFILSFYNSKGFNGCWCLRTIAEIPQTDIKIRAMIRKQKNEFLGFIKNLVKTNLNNKTEQQQEVVAKRTYLLYESAIAESHLHSEEWPIHEGIEMLKEICN